MDSRTDVPRRIPEDDHSWCHEVVQNVSRTFALTIDVLDEPMSSYICIGYLMCRIADTIEDATALSASEKVDLLERYDRVLAPCHQSDVTRFEDALEPHLPTERTDEWEVVANSSRVVRTFERLPADVQAAVTPPTRKLVDGMATTVETHAEEGGIRLRTEAELERYCYYVAGTVGHLITNLIGCEVDDDGVTDSLRNSAEEFGLLLQLVNIAKDVHADYTQENNVYLPAEWLDEVGVSQEELLAPETTRDVVAVVERTADHARTYLDDAQSYLETLAEVDQNAFAGWAIPFLLAVGTLRELSARPEAALSPGGVKISRDETFAVLTAVTEGIDQQQLATLRESIWRGTLY